MRDRILRTLHAGALWEVGFSGRSALSRDPILTTLRADRILRTLGMEAPCGNRWRTRNAPEHVPKRTWARAETHPARTRAADPKRTLPGPKWRARNAPAPCPNKPFERDLVAVGFRSVGLGCKGYMGLYGLCVAGFGLRGLKLGFRV